MIEITRNLFIGTTGEIKASEGFMIVNTSHTWHYELHAWQIRDHVDHSKDPCYVVCTDEPGIMSINWVDAKDGKYFDYNNEGTKVFKRALDFIEKNIKEYKVLVVCNKAESRAPSLGMVYLAKRTNLLSIPKIEPPEGIVYPFLELGEEDLDRPNYADARWRFTKLYPNYYPASGITEFLIDHWEEL